MTEATGDGDDVRAAAFDALFLDRWDRMVRRAYLVVGSVATAEEVVQDAFAEVYRRWPDIERHDAYLARVVTTGAIRRSTRANRERPTVIDEHAGPALVVDGPGPDRVLVGALLDRLDVRARAMVVLKFYDGLTETEIAEQVGCRPGTVGPTITRAIRRMAKEVER